MRLTVGPLPAAVYWRRRVFVLCAVLIGGMVVFYSFSGGSPADAGLRPTPSGTHTTHPTDPSPTILTPVTGRPPTTAAASPTGSAFTLPTTGGGLTGPCRDDELIVIASASATQVRAGSGLDVTIKFRNTSQRTCARDIGADMQELRILAGKNIVWSSDDCNANHGHDTESFAPGQEIKFTLRWNGRFSRGGTGATLCGAPPVAQPGDYELFGRLDTQLSAGFPFTIN
jgi:hypothetical protein